MTYLLDSNVFIEASNRFYPFDVCPGFWDLLDHGFNSGYLFSISEVYRELDKKGDELALWIKDRKTFFLPVESEDIQSALSKIVNYTNDEYNHRYKANRNKGENPKLRDFFAGADPWLIATALARVLPVTIVTHEVAAGKNCLKPKIPDIARQFNVKTCQVTDMLRKLKARFVLEDAPLWNSTSAQ